jgi:anti-sigma regulatory factor (Ser/Thr protein kinase)
VAFVRAALDAGEPVAVAVPGPNLALIRDALGRRAAGVHTLDMTVAGRNPGRIIPAVLLAFADRHRDRQVRIIGEPIWPGRRDDEYPACAQHEALINLAFAGRQATILCPYDAARLDDRAVADAARTHPVLRDVTGTRPSPDFAPQAVIDDYNVDLPRPAGTRVNAYLFNRASLEHACAYAHGSAVRLGLPADRVADLERCVAELTENSVRHGGGRGVLEVWAADGYVVCQVRDTGTITDPLAGRRPALADRSPEAGLLLANRAADLVRMHTGDGRTTVRLHFQLAA